MYQSAIDTFLSLRSTILGLAVRNSIVFASQHLALESVLETAEDERTASIHRHECSHSSTAYIITYTLPTLVSHSVHAATDVVRAVWHVLTLASESCCVVCSGLRPNPSSLLCIDQDRNRNATCKCCNFALTQSSLSIRSEFVASDLSFVALIYVENAPRCDIRIQPIDIQPMIQRSIELPTFLHSSFVLLVRTQPLAILFPPATSPPAHTDSSNMHSHYRPCHPLTAVTLVCASRNGLSTLASQISAFIDPARSRRWTIERACEYGNLRLLQRLIDSRSADAHKPQLYRSHVFSRALVHAVTHDNDMALLECLRTYCPDGFASLGMEAAARLGKLYVMQWIEQHHESGLIWSSRFAYAAAGGGHLNVLQWLTTKIRPARKRTEGIIKAAIRSGDVGTVQWLLEQTERDGIQLQDHNRAAFVEAACTAGHLAVTQYLLSQRAYQSLSSSRYCVCCRPAAASGNLELVEWLSAQGCLELIGKDIQIATDNGHADIVAWMLANDRDTQARSNSFLRDAAVRADFAITQLLYAFRPNLFRADVLTSKFQGAAETGDLALIEWLFAQLKVAIGQQSLSGHVTSTVYNAIASAASNGHLDIVQWLVANVRPLAHEVERVEQWAIGVAAEHGHVDVAKWLHANRSGTTPACYTIVETTGNGYLELVKWMLGDTKCTGDSTSLVYATAERGDLTTLQWLHSEFGCSLSEWEAYTTSMVVKKSYMHIVQWLLEQGYDDWSADLIDSATTIEMVEWLHANCPVVSYKTNAMIDAAKCGDFDTILLLHEHHSSDDCSVYAATRTQQINAVPIVQWLLETYPTINDAQDIRRKVRLYPASKVLFWTPRVLRDVSAYGGVHASASIVSS